MIHLTLPLTPLLNRYYRKFRNRMIISADGQAYKEEVSLICLAEGITPLTGPIALTAHIYRKQKRGDIDGYAKALLDVLQERAYMNDSQIIALHLYRHDDKHNPRVVVTISEVVA